MEREKRTLLVRLRRSIERDLARPFRRRKPRQRECSEDLLRDLMDFTGLGRDSALRWVHREGHRRIRRELEWVAPEDAAEYRWFYRGSRNYLFETGPPWARAVQLARPGLRCLDFGGGAGQNSLAMAAKGAEVFYVDIGIVTSEFVRFRAARRGLKVHVISPLVEIDGATQLDTVEAAVRVGGFDLIVCDNVLEHVPDYHLVVERLCEVLEPSGQLLELTPFKREKTYLFRRPPRWTVHLAPKVMMSEAMATANMRPIEEGLWEKQQKAPDGIP